MEEDKPTATHPASPRVDLLRSKFDEDIVNQAQRLAEVAKLMITVELAVPGLYATALKLIRGDQAMLGLGPAVYTAFFFWFIALVATLMTLVPKRYQVDRDIIRRSPPDEFALPLSIEAYFKKSAQHKYHAIVVSCVCFFAGIGAAVYSIV